MLPDRMRERPDADVVGRGRAQGAERVFRLVVALEREQRFRLAEKPIRVDGARRENLRPDRECFLVEGAGHVQTGCLGQHRQIIGEALQRVPDGVLRQRESLQRAVARCDAAPSQRQIGCHGDHRLPARQGIEGAAAVGGAKRITDQEIRIPGKVRRVLDKHQFGGTIVSAVEGLDHRSAPRREASSAGGERAECFQAKVHQSPGVATRATFSGNEVSRSTADDRGGASAWSTTNQMRRNEVGSPKRSSLP